MSFQAYIDNIKTKTGKSPDDFIKLAGEKGILEKGLLKPTVKAGQIVEWLKNDFQLGTVTLWRFTLYSSKSNRPLCTRF
jgi:hypothetical protein